MRSEQIKVDAFKLEDFLWKIQIAVKILLLIILHKMKILKTGNSIHCRHSNIYPLAIITRKFTLSQTWSVKGVASPVIVVTLVKGQPDVCGALGGLLERQA